MSGTAPVFCKAWRGMDDPGFLIIPSSRNPYGHSAGCYFSSKTTQGQKYFLKDRQIRCNSADLNLAEITQNTHNLHASLTKAARWPSDSLRNLADAGTVSAGFLTFSGDHRMVDLYLSLGVMLSLCGLAAFAGASLQQRAGRATVVSAEVLVCLATVAYLNFLWDRPSLSRLLPFSGTIILGNWLPIVGSFFLGVCLKTERITSSRRIVLAICMVAISGYSLAKPMLGEPPVCVPVKYDRTLDFQTTDQTCSAACAASLLRLHGVSANEKELANLCLTRHGTHWLGVYRGLKIKTAGTNWDVIVEEVSSQDLFSGALGPGILALSFHSAESGRKCDPEWGFESDVGHSVLILKSRYPAELAVFDPAPEYGFEVWDEDVLANMRKGILLRLVRRDGTQAVVQFDLNALKQDSSAYPSIVRR